MGVCQLAVPDSSDVRILPGPCVPSKILIFPATSSFAIGESVPTPTLPAPEGIRAICSSAADVISACTPLKFSGPVIVSPALKTALVDITLVSPEPLPRNLDATMSPVVKIALVADMVLTLLIMNPAILSVVVAMWLPRPSPARPSSCAFSVVVSTATVPNLAPKAISALPRSVASAIRLVTIVVVSMATAPNLPPKAISALPRSAASVTRLPAMVVVSAAMEAACAEFTLVSAEPSP